MKTITLLAGDGIGPEVSEATLRVIAAAGTKFEWESHLAGAAALEKCGTTLPQEVLDSIVRNGVGLKGPITTPIGTGFTSVNVQLRIALDLYASIRPSKNMPGVKSRYDGVDIIVVRENTEDLYSGLEHIVVPGVVESLKIITKRASTRIAIFAFEHARANGRKRVTAVHKANIMKLSDGLFLDCFREVAAGYPDIVADDRIVDNTCMQLVTRPEQFDVLLLENLYGDIVSDLCAGLVGGLGVVPGANFGEKGAVFEAVHGSAPDIAGKNVANPLALIQSAVMMLRHLLENAAADRIDGAVHKVLSASSIRTRDLGGTATTSEFTDAIVREIEAVVAAVPEDRPASLPAGGRTTSVNDSLFDEPGRRARPATRIRRRRSPNACGRGRSTKWRGTRGSSARRAFCVARSPRTACRRSSSGGRRAAARRPSHG